MFSSHEGMRVFGRLCNMEILFKTIPFDPQIMPPWSFLDDDDCSLTLWARGENLLMDSGLLYYEEKDLDRIHVRSAKVVRF